MFCLCSNLSADCRFCKKNVATKGNTSNLKAHLKRHHKSILETLQVGEKVEKISPLTINVPPEEDPDDPDIPNGKITEYFSPTSSASSPTSESDSPLESCSAVSTECVPI